MIRCKVCNDDIVKYYSDSNSIVSIHVNDNEYFICDTCSYDIALSRLNTKE